MRKGIYYALIASIISGIAIFYAKISVAKIDPLVLTTSRNFWAGITLITLFFTRNKLSELSKLPAKKLIVLFIMGLIGGAIPFYLFFTGLKLTNAQNANFIQKTLFVWVSLLSFVFLKEKVNFTYIICFLLIFIGNLFIMPAQLVFNRGAILVFAATLLWSLENILAHKLLKNISVEILGIFRMVMGSFFLFSFILASGKLGAFVKLSSQNILTIIIGGTILGFYVFFWLKALKYAQATLVTLVLSFSLVVGNLLNGSLAGLKLLSNDIYSSLLICLAVFLIIKNYLPRRWINKAY